jgi:prephenate dehydrogenase
MIGPGLRSTTRIAAANPTIMLDILQTNHAQSLAALTNFRTQVEAIANALENQDWDVLHSLLQQAASKQRTLIQDQR